MALLCLCMPTLKSSCIFNCLHLCLSASMSTQVYTCPSPMPSHAHACPLPMPASPYECTPPPPCLPPSHTFPRPKPAVPVSCLLFHLPVLSMPFPPMPVLPMPCLPSFFACPLSLPARILCLPAFFPARVLSLSAFYACPRPMPARVLCLPASYACPRPMPARVLWLPASHVYLHSTPICVACLPASLCLPGTVPIWLCSCSINIFYGSGGQLITNLAGSRSGSYPSIFVAFGSEFGSGYPVCISELRILILENNYCGFYQNRKTNLWVPLQYMSPCPKNPCLPVCLAISLYI